MIEIGKFSYFWLDTWVLANVVQLATQDFCTRFLNQKNDPCGRQYDQMTQAARSHRQTLPRQLASCDVEGDGDETDGRSTCHAVKHPKIPEMIL